MAAAFAATVDAFGGIDVVVSNAGIASSAAIDETTLAEWHRNHEILGTGYFLVAREAFRVLKRQRAGGSIVFIASKNALVAGKNAAAYSSAKAAELHLARCLAEEGGADGIRVNTVNPDAVLQGSKIWGSSWREERAAAYDIDPEELDEHYRQRNTLKVSILPQDIAEATLHFASERRSGKSTGNLLNVDGGVPGAYAAMIHLPTPFDRLVEDIALAGEQLTAMAACEGAAGNISVFTASLACPLDAVEDVELPARARSLAGGWMVITGGGRRLRDVGRRPESCVTALRIHDDGEHGLAVASSWRSPRRAGRGVDCRVPPVRRLSAADVKMSVTVDALRETIAWAWAAWIGHPLDFATAAA